MSGDSHIPDEQYNEWLRREVEIGLKEANDPNTIFSTADEVHARMASRRARHAASASQEQYTLPMNDETCISDEQEPEGYDEWLRRELEIGIREANDPNTVFVTLEESDARIERMRLLRDSSMMEKAS